MEDAGAKTQDPENLPKDQRSPRSQDPVDSLEDLTQKLMEAGQKLPLRKEYDGAFELCSPRPFAHARTRTWKKSYARAPEDWQLVVHHSAFSKVPHRIYEGPEPKRLVIEATELLESLYRSQ